MQSRQYAPFLILLGLLGGCGDDGLKERAGAPPEAAIENAQPAPDTATATANVDPPGAEAADAAGLYARACASCHGATGGGVGDFPSLVSLSRDDVQFRLEAYQKGERVGSRSAIMAPIAAQLSRDQIVALAAYLGS